jgi:hypothetical protein
LGRPHKRRARRRLLSICFEAPDYRLQDDLVLPARRNVQVAAFAYQIDMFETEAAFDASQATDVKYSSKSFIPSGLFPAAKDSTVPPQALAIFTGHVIDAGKKVNGLTGVAFHWALVETAGGTYDVVIDPELLHELPTVGSIISGSFWLSGRIS